ncbi:hypothetical protein C1631_012450 [Chryseobacterium phosphatilyticum]|uniref:PsbP C-terminal domain-containing protein n=1 Tax=Chryseobacterium phosphatilyticum TaxID=475075 RepID=A0A316X842_9FLAO|nr:hypothetical protein [Chryseobacterium phosphatilyticum]PWN68886.1 hypothetical protein C1631_012450 [Chryseobacterium phosphatilyticum]
MKFKFLILFLLAPVFFLQAQSKAEKANDYLNIPGPIHLGQKVYNLVWSSHPNENYFKQEYVSSDENVNRYNSMILIDFIKGDFSITDVIDQKVSELEKMKKVNPVVNYKVFEKDGEYILDFLISENSKDGKEILIAERNVYRYKLITQNNNRGVLLFAVSERGYDENMDAFFNNLKSNSSRLIETVGKFKIPDIEIK